MQKQTQEILNELCARYPSLINIREQINAAYETLFNATKNGGKIFVCGNGGSAADSEHIVGELMKSFKKRRKIDGDVYSALGAFGENGQALREVLEGAIPSISLTSHLSLSTAFSNDKEPTAAFAQQLYGLANKNDVLICISTSGNSKNCVLAAIVAKAMGLSVVCMTGERESELSKISDVALRVPETETFKVQELHLPIYHCLCAMLEEQIF